MTDCIFCRIIKGELPSYILKETEETIVFLSLEGHPLIVPKNHLKDIFSLDSKTAAKIMEEAVIIAKALKEATNCEGINLSQANGSAAGQDVFHFHLHIKPRWKNDGISLQWDTKSKDHEDQLNLKNAIILALH